MPQRGQSNMCGSPAVPHSLSSTSSSHVWCWPPPYVFVARQAPRLLDNGQALLSDETVQLGAGDEAGETASHRPADPSEPRGHHEIAVDSTVKPSSAWPVRRLDMLPDADHGGVEPDDDSPDTETSSLAVWKTSRTVARPVSKTLSNASTDALMAITTSTMAFLPIAPDAPGR